MIRAAVFAFALIAATGCTQPADTLPERSSEPEQAMPQTREEATARDSCGASRFLNLVGTEASAIDQSTLPQDARIVAPDSVVTQDFRPDRLNVMVGSDGRVSSLACY